MCWPTPKTHLRDPRQGAETCNLHRLLTRSPWFFQPPPLASSRNYFHRGTNQTPQAGPECQEAAGGHLFNVPPSEEVRQSPDLAISWLRCASLPTVSSPTVRLRHDLRDVNSLDPSAPEHNVCGRGKEMISILARLLSSLSKYAHMRWNRMQGY